MPILDQELALSPGEDSRLTYLIDCHRCGKQFDSAQAAWCRCLAKERSLVCPHCADCFCNADSNFKLKFWTSAPPLLWERKLKNARRQLDAFTNPPPEHVRRPLVMVVDDDREICAIAVRLISEIRLGVIVATDGEEAIRLAHTYKPDVVLTDALMPKIDGREVCRTIKSDDALAATKVLIMSSVYTSSRIRREALTHFRADAFLVKPVSPAALREALARATATDLTLPPETPPASDDLPPSEPALMVAAQSGPDLMLSIAAAGVVTSPTETIVPISVADDPPITKTIENPSTTPSRRMNVDDLIRLHHAGVDVALIQEMRAYGYELTIDDMIELRRAGVSADFLRRMSAASDAQLSPDELRILARAAAVTDDDHAARLLILGFAPSDVGRLIAGGVDSAMVEELQSLGLMSLTATELVRLKASGVAASFVADLRLLGLDTPGVAELIMLVGAGVTSETVRELESLNVDIRGVADLLRLQSSGVNGALLREMAAPRER